MEDGSIDRLTMADQLSRAERGRPSTNQNASLPYVA